MVALDTLISINAAPESDNSIMRRVMTLLRADVAVHHDCALCIAHHDVEGGSDDTANDATNSRGAGDIINAARFELAVRGMTEQQAKDFGLRSEQRKWLFRVGSMDSKRNYGAPDDAEWFERLERDINGEGVVSCKPWTPPTQTVALDDCLRLVEAIGNCAPTACDCASSAIASASTPIYVPASPMPSG